MFSNREVLRYCNFCDRINLQHREALRIRGDIPIGKFPKGEVPWGISPKGKFYREVLQKGSFIGKFPKRGVPR